MIRIIFHARLTHEQNMPIVVTHLLDYLILQTRLFNVFHIPALLPDSAAVQCDVLMFFRIWRLLAQGPPGSRRLRPLGLAQPLRQDVVGRDRGRRASLRLRLPNA